MNRSNARKRPDVFGLQLTHQHRDLRLPVGAKPSGAKTMGMFDEIVCDAPLPDGDNRRGSCFQTKSFSSPCLFRYRITGEGRLIDVDGNDIEPDGDITFYTTEREGRESEAHESSSLLREYRARFASGQLQNIVRVDANANDNVCYGLASYRWFQTRSFVFGNPDDEHA